MNRWAMLLAGWLAVSAPVMGDDGYAAPKLDAGPPWGAIIVIVVCVLGIALSVLRNARRSHQDID